MNYEIQYLSVLDKLLSQPVRGDRTGTGTHSMFGIQLHFDLQEAFPLLQTKFVSLKNIFHELKWMLMGETNIKYLVDNGVNIWNDWPLKYYNSQRLPDQDPATMQQFIDAIKNNHDFAKRWGDCGPVYGYQWRRWPHFRMVENSESYAEPLLPAIDQVADVLKQLRNNPESRRIIISAWNVADLEQMAVSGLPPCHLLMQFYTRPIDISKKLEPVYAIPDAPPTSYLDCPTRYLDCQVYIRSNDWFLGAPYNIAQYALMTHLMAKCVGMLPGNLVYTVGDAHLYLNHEQAALEQISRPLTKYYAPLLRVTKTLKDPAEIEWEDLLLEGYFPQPPIKAPIAV